MLEEYGVRSSVRSHTLGISGPMCSAPGDVEISKEQGHWRNGIGHSPTSPGAGLRPGSPGGWPC